MFDGISRASVSRVSTLTGVSESIRSRTKGAVTMIVSDCTEWPCTSLAAPEGCDGEAAAAAAAMDTRNAAIVWPSISFGGPRCNVVSCQQHRGLLAFDVVARLRYDEYIGTKKPSNKTSRI